MASGKELTEQEKRALGGPYHRLRSQLTSILGSAGLILHSSTDDNISRWAQTIEDQVGRMLETIEELAATEPRDELN